VGGVSGANFKVGGAKDIFVDAFFDGTAAGPVAGNTIHVKNDGTMTFTGHVSALLSGTAVAPITIDGYNTSRGDNPTGTNRPLIAAGGKNLIFTNYWIIKNLRVTVATIDGLRVGLGSRVENVFSNNSSGSASAKAIYLYSTYGFIVSCEAQAVNGGAFWDRVGRCSIVACYAHDSVTGVRVYVATPVMMSVFDTCTTGIDVVSSALNSILNNTIYNCTTGLTGTTGYTMLVANNILDANTTCASWTTEQKNNYFDYNCWDNTTDVSNVTKGDNAVTGDPGLTDPANGDFTLGSGSNCLDTGLQLGTDQGVVGDYKWNIGVDQNDVAAGALAFIQTRRNTLIGR